MNQTSNKPTQHKEYKKLLELKQSQIEELQMKYDQIENKLFEYEKNAQSKHNESNKYNKIEASNDYTKKIADLERIIREKNKEIQELKDREKDLASEIEIFKHQSSGFSKPGLEVNEKYEKLCLDIEELRDERDQLKEAMNEAINQCATSLVKQQALEKENQKFLKQVENLSNSKLLMQTTMADQINSLRGQIQRLKEEKTDRSIKIINE
jgi:chromosome segregation ATPase